MQNVTCKTDKGKIRQNNEDSLLCIEEKNFYMVADGVGGHNSGELASKLAVDYVRDYITNNPIISDDDTYLMNYFLECLSEVNAIIYERASKNIEDQGMATTAALLYIRNNKAYVVNVGDSRAYLARDGELIQITEDHTYVNELLKRGSISAEEAKDHPKRNMITRALGSKESIEPDFYKFDIYKGDIILLCTDGLYNEIDVNEINSLITNSTDTSTIAHELIKRANEQGGNDNITVICVEI
ncbi:MAG: Stp1/IreP family PP2C-type Ser/Thr phosphatase [Clostridiales bacterium]|nr:Stp1/IreP family PP2C-type Ser/Thr phosphatase [Clostridiales bacterium]